MNVYWIKKTGSMLRLFDRFVGRGKTIEERIRVVPIIKERKICIKMFPGLAPSVKILLLISKYKNVLVSLLS